ncbi:MAG: TolC family protein, partial [Desulfohalobiaceae bacterium]
MKRHRFSFLCGWFTSLLLVLGALPAGTAEIDEPVSPLPQGASPLTLEDFVPELVSSSDRIQAAAARLQSSEYGFKEARSGWLPRLDLTADAGYEHIDFADRQTTGEDHSSEWKNVQTLQLRQLLYDFGQTGGTIGRARAVLEQSDFNLQAVTQEIMRQGVGAYLQVYRAHQQLGYARRSEENIMRQTGIEESLVERGAGLSSDVLQAKSQLSGANARRVSLEGELVNAVNRFRAVYFVDLADDQVQRFVLPDIPSRYLPMTLEEALDIGLAENPQLEVARKNIQAVEQDIEVIKSRFYPRLDFVAEGRRRQND